MRARTKCALSDMALLLERHATLINAVHSGIMAYVAPELLTLLIAERLALERLDRLRGYPDDVVKAAESLWREAAEAVRDYRAKHP
jgi:hypothetical protein